MKIEFDTTKFVYEHGVQPKGRGSWWFSFEGYEFSTVGTLADAKKACKEEVKRLAPEGYKGTVIVDIEG